MDSGEHCSLECFILLLSSGSLISSLAESESKAFDLGMTPPPLCAALWLKLIV